MVHHQSKQTRYDSVNLKPKILQDNIQRLSSVTGDDCHDITHQVNHINFGHVALKAGNNNSENGILKLSLDWPIYMAI